MVDYHHINLLTHSLNTYTLSFPPVTIKPSVTVVNMQKTGPEWTFFTMRVSKFTDQM